MLYTHAPTLRAALQTATLRACPHLAYKTATGPQCTFDKCCKQSTKPDSKFEFTISHHPCSQVCKGGLRLLSGTAVLQEVAIETLAALIPASGVPGSPGSVFITGAAVCDPYLLLRLSDDRALLLCASPETGAEGLPVLWSLLPESRIRGCVCVCVHSIPYLG